MAELFDGLIAKANQSPIPAPGCLPDTNTSLFGACRERVTGYDITFSAPDRSLASPTLAGWPVCAQALKEAVSGNATRFSTLFETGINSDSFSGIAIGCLDWVANATSFS